MQFVPIKTVEQQSALMMHRARQLLVGQRTRLGNAIRGHLAELGIVAAQGQRGLAALLAMVARPEDTNLPAIIRPVLHVLVEQWHSLVPQIAALEQQIAAWHKSNPDSLRLASQPQFGPILSSALVATPTGQARGLKAHGDATRFNSGRQFSAWIGIVPKQNSTGGKERLGGITKTGDRYLRQLLVVAATGLIPHGTSPWAEDPRARANPQIAPWFAGLLARMPAKKAAVALANKACPGAGRGWPASPGPCSSSKPPTARRGPSLPPRPLNHIDQPQDTPPPGNPMRGRWKLMSTDRSDRGSAQPELSLSFELVAMIGEPTHGSHQGQRPIVPRTKAGHMTAPDSVLPIQFFFPCTAGAVHT